MPDLARLELPESKVLQDRALRLFVDAPIAVHRLRDPQLTSIEGGDHLLDALG